MKLLFELLLSFMKIGGFTFGGGYAMISLIEDECVQRKKWITHDEMVKITVIAESTPGPIAINCATFVGFRQAGVIGSVFATLGMVVPSFGVIYIISMFLDDFLEYEIVAHAFQGIKLAVGILIFNVGLNMLRKMAKENTSRMIYMMAFLAMLLTNIFAWNFSSISLIVVAAIVGIIVACIRNTVEGERVE